MNLAIHHAVQLEALQIAQRTLLWDRRGIVPWANPDLIRSRAVYGRLVASGLLRALEVHESDAGFFEIFRHRLRRVHGVASLSAAEEKLLFLALTLSSVLMTGEPVVAAVAKEIGLRVCFGNTEPETYFSSPAHVSMGAMGAMGGMGGLAEVVVPELQKIFFSNQFPSRWRVPEGDEPVQSLAYSRSVRSSGCRVRRHRAQP